MPNRTVDTPAPPAELARAQALARLLDTSVKVPGTSFRVGLDPIIGLIPGLGDFAGVLLSTAILVSAARLGVPRPILLRMAANIGVEALVGTVPILGDLFDAGWRANMRNVRLMERSLAEPARAAKSSRRWLVTTAAALGAALLALVAGAAWLLITVLQALGFG